MKILLDHNVNRRFQQFLIGHDVKTTREMRWEQLSNGKLLAHAAAEQFDVLIGIDKKLEYEQNLQTLPIAIVVLDVPNSSLNALKHFAPSLNDLLSSRVEKALYFIEVTGVVLRLTSPRPKQS